MKTYNYLLEHGIKPSMQRIAIMDYLLTHKDHPSIDAIFMALSKKMPTLSKTTVYNTLKLFVENGAAQMLKIVLIVRLCCILISYVKSAVKYMTCLFMEKKMWKPSISMVSLLKIFIAITKEYVRRVRQKAIKIN
mgnify:CR=1 FL=1